MEKAEASYWIALAHLPKWGPSRINHLVVKFAHENQLSIQQFFSQSQQDWSSAYGLDSKQIADLTQAKLNLPNNAFLADSLLNQGFDLIPITSSRYSKILKANLKTSHAPPLLYIKGNAKLLAEESIAIVGSRNASEAALTFTDNVAKLSSEQFKVVVSGFAKGVDKQALDSAVAHHGQSIIVLPQGIMTFSSGFKNYYKQIISGDVLVLSTFFPKSPWKAELAMARNPIIYGLASDIYVAESADKGGTWSGVLDGLKKGRRIFVRQPHHDEKNANQLLIQRGAIPVDNLGKKLYPQTDIPLQPELTIFEESENSTEIAERIRLIITDGPISGKELNSKLDISWTSQKLSNFLKKLDFVEVIKRKNSNTYQIKQDGRIAQMNLFDDVSS